jgi:hypothetical protein
MGQRSTTKMADIRDRLAERRASKLATAAAQSSEAEERLRWAEMRSWAAILMGLAAMFISLLSAG